MLAAPNKQHISLIRFITAAVDELNYNASRSSLVPLLKCTGNHVPMMGISRVPACLSRLKEEAGWLSHQVPLCLAGGRLPLTAGVQKETEGNQGHWSREPVRVLAVTSIGYRL